MPNSVERLRRITGFSDDCVADADMDDTAAACLAGSLGRSKALGAGGSIPELDERCGACAAAAGDPPVVDCDVLAGGAS